jgi:hypothetical protein
MLPIRRWLSLVLLICPLLAREAYGNGINPPRPSGAKVVEATCVDRRSGVAVIVQRAQITIDEASELLELRLSDTSARSVQLTQIRLLQILSSKPKADGFAKASMILLDPGYEGPGQVRLRSKAKPVRLTGFAADLERVDRVLASCKELSFTAPTSAPVERSEVRKK